MTLQSLEQAHKPCIAGQCLGPCAAATVWQGLNNAHEAIMGAGGVVAGQDWRQLHASFTDQTLHMTRFLPDGAPGILRPSGPH